MQRIFSDRRVFAAMVTPLDGAFRCDERRLITRARFLLDEGCDGVCLFGTTGEGAAFAASERMRVLDAVLECGFPRDRLIVSTSAASLADTCRLSDHAASAGVAAVLVMPSFFLGGSATGDGVAAWFDHVVAALDGRAPLILYHFPAVSGVPLGHPLIRGLIDRHGVAIAGVKDSGGDPEHTLALCRAFPEIAVLPGQETDIPALSGAGIAGTICGLANIAPGLVQRLFDDPDSLEGIAALDRLAESGPFISTLRAMIAVMTGDDAWAMPTLPRWPREPAEIAEAVRTLDAELRDRWGTGLV